MKEIAFADFGLEEYHRRVQRAAAAMGEAELDALIITDPTNLRYLFGFQDFLQISATRSFVAVFFRDDPQDSRLFMPHDCQGAPQVWTSNVTFWDEGHEPPFDDRMADMDKVVQCLKARGLDKGRLGMELGAGTRLGLPVGAFDQLRNALDRACLCDAADLLWELRKIKSDAEIDVLRQAGSISARAIEYGKECLEEGITERQLYCKIHARMFDEGIDGQGLLTVLFGPAAWQRPHTPPTDERPLRRGDWVYLDGGGAVKGYCADVCRMAMIGGPDERRSAVHHAVKEVQQEMIAAIRPGLRCCDVYQVGRELLERKGLKYMIDSLSFGHGIGLNVHEMPDLNLSNPEPLQEGMVLAVEPWIIDRSELGLFNNEDMVVVRKEGAEVISCL